MPDRQYIARNEPPSVGDRAAAHVVELVLAGGSGLAGLSMLVDSALPAWVASLSLKPVPDWAVFAIGLWMLVGAATAVSGILWPGGPSIHTRWRVKLDKKWAVEKFGWTLVSSAWLCYAVAILAAYPMSTLGWGMPFILALAGIGRNWFLKVLEAATRSRIGQRQKGLGDDG